ncbi:MAG: peptide chain release factor N(5)-glutamine methyltransferase, partial [Pseudomonadota bacterium]|nr:peptide chain release factor N(5)-glutamine methyltransferase [Pseudomonadota bacterium]
MRNIISILTAANQELEKKKIETSNLECQILLSFTLGVSKEYLIINANEELDDKKINQFKNLIKRRLDGESISNITGKREFYGREFIVNCNVLDPRSDTELIIDIIKDLYAKDDDFSLIDLGTGSGCIISTLLLEFPNSSGIGSDISENALNIAQLNANKYFINHRVSFILSDWLDAINFNKFDIIISNPPYILSKDLERLPLEVLYNDPLIALDGGIDGLMHYKKIISNLQNKSNDETKFLIMEVNEDMTKELFQLLTSVGFERKNINLYDDLSSRK